MNAAVVTSPEMADFTAKVNPSPEILNSWKEIARYLDRGVRTVQRWEGELGLPVRRPHGRGRSAVFAVRSELDAWLRSCPLEKQPAPFLVKPNGIKLSTSTLLTDAHQLRSRLHDSRKELGEAINRLVLTLGKMLPPGGLGPIQP